jgi:hypothetical protein
MRARLRTVALIWVGIAAVLYLVDLAGQLQVGLTDGDKRPFGDDYINYWSAAVLAWSGRASQVYDLQSFHDFQVSVVGPTLDGYIYSYPPVLLLISAPLAFLPYVPGLFAWLGASWFAFYHALRLAAPRHAILLALAPPAVFLNTVGGQNGAWSAALIGGGLGLVDRRPLLAGGLFGLLAYKPQLGLLIPIALIAGRRWKAFAAAAFVGIALVALSGALFGVDVWNTYLRNLAALRGSVLEDGEGVWHRMVSVFVFARRLGLDVSQAYLVQAIAGVCGASIVAVAWYREVSPGLRNSALVLATLLATPYLQDYDLVVCAFVAAWILGSRSPSDADNASAFVGVGLLLLLPLVAAPVGVVTGYAIGPLFILPIFGWVAMSVLASLSNRAEPTPGRAA